MKLSFKAYLLHENIEQMYRADADKPWQKHENIEQMYRADADKPRQNSISRVLYNLETLVHDMDRVIKSKFYNTYDPEGIKFTKDLKKRVLQIIGDPEVVYSGYKPKSVVRRA